MELNANDQKVNNYGYKNDISVIFIHLSCILTIADDLVDRLSKPYSSRIGVR